jgi:hypothetical protein
MIEGREWSSGPEQADQLHRKTKTDLPFIAGGDWCGTSLRLRESPDGA